MSVLPRLAHYQNRRDEVPNQELARDLASKKDRAGIREIAEHLWDNKADVAANCIKVLYEVGYIDPSLIGGYVDDFARLLKSRNNRLIWGGMIALAEAARANPDAVYRHLAEIKKAMDAGSVITVDNAVKALAHTAAANIEYNAAIFPTLLKHLQTCRPKDVAQHSEKTLLAVNAVNKKRFIAALEKRMEDLSASQAIRVKKVIKQASVV